LGDKLGYLQIRSQNELTDYGFVKDYDAVITVRTEIGEYRFALEYERRPKAMKYYLNPASSLLFPCKFAQKSSFAPTIYAAVDEF